MVIPNPSIILFCIGQQMPANNPLPLKVRIQRPIIRWGFRAGYRLAARVEILGRENIPKEGPYLITFNHVSIFDPPLLLGFWPSAPEALGAEYLWDKKGIGSIMRGYGAIPVSRDFFDRKLLNTSLDILRTGKTIVVAPEGTRSHEPGLLPGKPGIAYIAVKADAIIIPVGITGTTSELFRRATRLKRSAVTMRIGAPFRLPKSDSKDIDRKATRQQNADLVMTKIAELLPEEYRGVYADNVSNSLVSS
jgi:1-acyl-sn-glycerol-3-phosphate acyltransferase